MEKLIPKSLLLMLWITMIAFPAFAGELPREILGVGLKMTKEEAKKRLGEIGTFVRDERGWQEIWQLRDESFSHLIVGFGKDGKLHYVTATAREDKDAKRVAYEKIGNLNDARQAGDVKIKNFNYQWDIPANKENPHMLVIAAGRDPKFLTTYSLKNLDNVSAKGKKD